MVPRSLLRVVLALEAPASPTLLSQERCPQNMSSDFPAPPGPKALWAHGRQVARCPPHPLPSLVSAELGPWLLAPPHLSPEPCTLCGVGAAPLNLLATGSLLLGRACSSAPQHPGLSPLLGLLPTQPQNERFWFRFRFQGQEAAASSMGRHLRPNSEQGGGEQVGGEQVGGEQGGGEQGGGEHAGGEQAGGEHTTM